MGGWKLWFSVCIIIGSVLLAVGRGSETLTGAILCKPSPAAIATDQQSRQLGDGSQWALRSPPTAPVDLPLKMEELGAILPAHALELARAWPVRGPILELGAVLRQFQKRLAEHSNQWIAPDFSTQPFRAMLSELCRIQQSGVVPPLMQSTLDELEGIVRKQVRIEEIRNALPGDALVNELTGPYTAGALSLGDRQQPYASPDPEWRTFLAAIGLRSNYNFLSSILGGFENALMLRRTQIQTYYHLMNLQLALLFKKNTEMRLRHFANTHVARPGGQDWEFLAQSLRGALGHLENFHQSCLDLIAEWAAPGPAYLPRSGHSLDMDRIMVLCDVAPGIPAYANNGHLEFLALALTMAVPLQEMAVIHLSSVRLSHHLGPASRSRAFCPTILRHFLLSGAAGELANLVGRLELQLRRQEAASDPGGHQEPPMVAQLASLVVKGEELLRPLAKEVSLAFSPLVNQQGREAYGDLANNGGNGAVLDSIMGCILRLCNLAHSILTPILKIARTSDGDFMVGFRHCAAIIPALSRVAILYYDLYQLFFLPRQTGSGGDPSMPPCLPVVWEIFKEGELPSADIQRFIRHVLQMHPADRRLWRTKATFAESAAHVENLGGLRATSPFPPPNDEQARTRVGHGDSTLGKRSQVPTNALPATNREASVPSYQPLHNGVPQAKRICTEASRQRGTLGLATIAGDAMDWSEDDDGFPWIEQSQLGNSARGAFS